ncbi:MAG TPA: neutral zinc metallopeptidase [Microlunatus sp.]|nr:neutral zinc metallopeptidase [Microlunatus sp.]
MTQQQWGGAPYGQRPYGNQPPSGWGGQGFNQPSYGAYGVPGLPPGQRQAHPPGGFGGPQPGVPHYGPPAQPPRRRSPLMSLLLGLVAVSVLAIVGLVLVNVVTGSSDTAYQNDDYQVPPPDSAPPPIPLPTTYAEAEDGLVDNKLYAQTAPIPVRCDNPPINVANASDADLEVHFNSQVECLMRVWNPPVTAAGFLLPRPSVTIYGEKVTTKCGEAGVNAFYCSADQQIYFSNLLPQAVPIVRTNKWAADVVMAHEFGHAIQGRTGLLVSAHALAQNAGSERESNQLIRRLETQADCFSGVYARSVSRSMGIQQADLRGIEDTYVAVGDDTLTGDPNVEGNHGLARSRVFWGVTGLGTSDIGKCNTFAAPANQVR